MRAGDGQAETTLVQRYKDLVLQRCRFRLGRRWRGDAEDVVQETFIKAFALIREDDRPIELKPTLLRIAQNLCSDHVKKSSRRAQIAPRAAEYDVDNAFADSGTSAADQVEGKEEFRLVMSDLRRLSEPHREVLLLNGQGLSYKAIAARLGLNVPKVKALLFRARRRFADIELGREIPCDDVQQLLSQNARLKPPAKAHVEFCQDCRSFKQQLKKNDRRLAALSPVGPLLALKGLLLTKLGLSAAGGGAVGTAAAATLGAGGLATTAVVAVLVTGGGGDAGPRTVPDRVRENPPADVRVAQQPAPPAPSDTPAPVTDDGKPAPPPEPAAEIEPQTPEPALPPTGAPGAALNPAPTDEPTALPRGRSDGGSGGGERRRPPVTPPQPRTETRAAPRPAPTVPLGPPADALPMDDTTLSAGGAEQPAGP